jgi:hypothetical protein
VQLVRSTSEIARYEPGFAKKKCQKEKKMQSKLVRSTSEIARYEPGLVTKKKNTEGKKNEIKKKN